VINIYIITFLFLIMITTKNWKIINALIIVLLWIFFGTFVFWYLESSWTWIDSFYFAVSTLTTVGYGDLTPVSQFGRLVAALYILFGVGIVLASLSFIGSEFLKREEYKIRKGYNRQSKVQGVEVTSEIENVKKILLKNTKELKEQAEILEGAGSNNIISKVKNKKKEIQKLKGEINNSAISKNKTVLKK